MEDKLRFRAWDKVNKKMYKVICLNCHRQEEIIVSGLYGTKYIKNIPWDNCDILQCTGLTDKNGKLIYEGDIVKDTMYKDGTICDETYLKVVRDTCIFRFEPDMVFTDLFYHHHKVEVVGNIYENPELMERNDI